MTYEIIRDYLEDFKLFENSVVKFLKANESVRNRNPIT
jgi:hypothetical protein